MSKRKKAKYEGKNRRGRRKEPDLALRFAAVECKELRVKMPNRLVMLEEDLKRVEELSKEYKISRSLVLEKLYWRFVLEAKEHKLALIRDKRCKKRLRGEIVKMPVFSVHPVVLEGLRNLAKRRGVSLSVSVHLIIGG